MSKSIFIIAAALVVPFLTTSVTMAAENGQWAGHRGFGFGEMKDRTPGVFGTVSAINGNVLTVTSNGFGKNATTTTTYAVDASNAKITKNGAAGNIGAISVGDRLMARGTLNGTNLAATSIIDGIPSGMPWGRRSSSTAPMPVFQGNGEPVVGGTITAINGSTLTVTNKNNVAYTVDASNAKIVKGNAASSLANVGVNDNVLVQGTVNGTSVTASSVIDQGATQNQSANNGDSAEHRNLIGRMLGGIDSFFHNLFGFF